jgi:hypothetical protein
VSHDWTFDRKLFTLVPNQRFQQASLALRGGFHGRCPASAPLKHGVGRHPLSISWKILRLLVGSETSRSRPTGRLDLQTQSKGDLT